MRGETISKISDQLKRHEGLRLKAYLDSEGVLTVGYGHNLKTSPVHGVTKPGDSITKETADKLFDSDLAASVWDMRRNMPWAFAMSEARQGVLVNMIFNMGVVRVLGFHKALAAMERGDYAAAAREMLDSKWASQVGKRAGELARQMESGEWQS